MRHRCRSFRWPFFRPTSPDFRPDPSEKKRRQRADLCKRAPLISPPNKFFSLPHHRAHRSRCRWPWPGRTARRETRLRRRTTASLLPSLSVHLPRHRFGGQAGVPLAERPSADPRPGVPLRDTTGTCRASGPIGTTRLLTGPRVPAPGVGCGSHRTQHPGQDTSRARPGVDDLDPPRVAGQGRDPGWRRRRRAGEPAVMGVTTPAGNERKGLLITQRRGRGPVTHSGDGASLWGIPGGVRAGQGTERSPTGTTLHPPRLRRGTTDALRAATYKSGAERP